MSLAVYEKCNTKTKAPRLAIECARRFADGNADLDELSASRSAARSAQADIIKQYLM
jgi:hypothetical protein